MNVGIITHYDVHNHGAHLQLYAMIQVLKELGYDAKALTYNKNYDFMEDGIENKYRISIHSVPIYIKYLKEKGLGCTLFNFKKKKILDKFREKEDLVGCKYSKAENMEFVIIGSDEIFSIEPGLNPCFWGMGVPCEKLISYAASFGPTTMDFINKHYAVEFIKAGISRISNISVRDEYSGDLIYEISGITPEIVCDPVLLYGFDDEREKADSFNPKERYLIVYAYDYNMNDPETISEIKEYARKNSLKVLSIGFYHKWCDKNINVTPLELFKWFANASAVVTDTFHGTILSILNETPFASIVRGNENKLKFLLSQYNLSAHIANSPENICDILDKDIDFNALRKITEQIRESSMNYLRSAIGRNYIIEQNRESSMEYLRKAIGSK